MYQIIRIKNISEWFELSSQMESWAFRGQENKKWALQSTLIRLANKYKTNIDAIYINEKEMMRNFKRKAHLYIRDKPDNDFEWLALMQHYGAPTRLLDFSYSFYISSFFALESATEDSAVWAFNLGILKARVCEVLSINNFNTNMSAFNDEMIKTANHSISREQDKEQSGKTVGHIFVEPHILHERLVAQQGLFLFPVEIERSFDIINETMSQNEETPNDADTDFKRGLVYKFIIPIELRAEILSSLKKMNITAGTLFPGLDGFSRSMGSHVSLCPTSKL